MIKKIKSILTKKQIISLNILFLLSFITMILEAVGLGLIIPFVQSLTSESINDNFLKIVHIFNFNPSNKKELITVIIYFMFFIYTVKALYLTFFSYAQTKLLADLRVSLSNKLFNIYLNKPFQFHLRNNSSKLIRNIDEISLVVSLFQFLILLITELVVLVGVSIFIILYEPIGSLIVISFLSIFGYVFYKKVQIRAKEWGKGRQFHSGLRIKQLREGFTSIKYIKILNRINEVLKVFTNNNIKLNSYEIKQNFTDSLPRLWLEWLVIVGFILLIIIMLFLNKDFTYIVSVLGLFAAAAFRLMPSLTRIMNSIQKIIYNRPAIDIVYKEFQDYDKNLRTAKDNLNKLQFYKKINFKSVSFKYSGSDKLILDNLNFTIEAGSIVGIIGESGSGKTTLINLILGLLEPTDGEINIDNDDMLKNLPAWQNYIGYVPQDVYLVDDTIKKNIAFALPETTINDEAVDLAIKKSKLDKLINNLDKGKNTQIGEFGDRLSGGQKQRISIARALYSNPRVLIFDEFTNSLDIETEKKIIEEIINFKRDKTVIMIAHRLSTLKSCDSIYKIENSKIAKVENLNEN
jgi:ATP-binding cassette, subfamily B, bacterial PglK